MTYRSTALLVALALVQGSAFAGTFSMKSNSAPALMAETEENCPDFSGTYEEKCGEDDEADELTLVSHGCSLEVKNEALTLRPGERVERARHGAKGFLYRRSFYPEWKENNSKLEVLLTDTANDPSAPMYHSLHQTLTLELQGRDLKATNRHGSETHVCVFKRLR
jgi:hypothetical protein